MASDTTPAEPTMCCRNPALFVKSNCEALSDLINNVEAILDVAGLGPAPGITCDQAIICIQDAIDDGGITLPTGNINAVSGSYNNQTGVLTITLSDTSSFTVSGWATPIAPVELNSGGTLPTPLQLQTAASGKPEGTILWFEGTEDSPSYVWVTTAVDGDYTAVEKPTSGVVVDAVVDLSGILSIVKDGDKVTTLGYYIKGDGGGNDYYYSAFASNVCDGGFVLDGPGGDNSPAATAATYPGSSIDGRFVALSQLTANSKQFGAKGNGTTDDTFRITSVLLAAKKVDISGNHLISSKITISSIDNLHVYGGGSIEPNFIDDGPLTFLLCNEMVFENINCKGIEDRTSWEAQSEVDRQKQLAIFRFNSCNNIRIINIKGSRYRGLILVDSCSYVYVEGCFHVGPFGPFSSGVVIDKNFSYALFLNACTHSTVNDCWSNDCGGTILVGESSNIGTVYGGGALDNHDNGAYVSSGYKWLIDGFRTSSGYGNSCKCRGANNWIKNCIAKDCESISFVLSGIPLDSLVDSQGAVGAGGGIVDCESVDSFSLLRIDSITGNGPLLYLRDIEIRGNKGFDLTSTTAPGIQVFALRNINVTGNSIDGFAAEFAMLIQGVSGAARSTGYLYSHNQARRGRALARLTFLKNADISHNRSDISLTDVTTIDTVDCENLIFENNNSDDFTNIIDLRSSISCEANNNLMRILGDTGTFIVRNNFIDPVIDVTTEIPKRIGQEVLYSSNYYRATGISSVADWKQIT